MDSAAASIWASIKDTHDVGELRDFYETFPGTEQAFLARRRLSLFSSFQEFSDQYYNAQQIMRDSAQQNRYNWDDFTIDRCAINHKINVAERVLKDFPDHPYRDKVVDMLGWAEKEREQFKINFPDGY